MKKLLLAFGFIGAIPATSFSQGRMVSGTVTAAEDGLGLPGVTVVEKGTQNATFSDIDGKFTLPVSGDEVTLVFSFIGYRSKEVASLPANPRTSNWMLISLGWKRSSSLVTATKSGARFPERSVPSTPKKSRLCPCSEPSRPFKAELPGYR